MNAVHQQGKHESPARAESPDSPLQRDAFMQLGIEENQQHPARVPSPHSPPQQDSFMQLSTEENTRYPARVLSPHCPPQQDDFMPVGTSDTAQIKAPSPAYMESTKSDQVAPEPQDQRKGTYEKSFQEEDCYSSYFWGECVLETCQAICCCYLLFAG